MAERNFPGTLNTARSWIGNKRRELILLGGLAPTIIGIVDCGGGEKPVSQPPSVVATAAETASPAPTAEALKPGQARIDAQNSRFIPQQEIISLAGTDQLRPKWANVVSQDSLPMVFAGMERTIQRKTGAGQGIQSVDHVWAIKFEDDNKDATLLAIADGKIMAPEPTWPGGPTLIRLLLPDGRNGIFYFFSGRYELASNDGSGNVKMGEPIVRITRLGVIKNQGSTQMTEVIKDFPTDSEYNVWITDGLPNPSRENSGENTTTSNWFIAESLLKASDGKYIGISKAR